MSSNIVTVQSLCAPYPFYWPKDVIAAFKDVTGQGTKEIKHYMTQNPKWAPHVLDKEEREWTESQARSNGGGGPYYSNPLGRIAKAKEMIAAFEASKLPATIPETLEAKVSRLEREIADVRDMAVKDQAEIHTLKTQVFKLEDEGEVSRPKARINAILKAQV